MVADIVNLYNDILGSETGRSIGLGSGLHYQNIIISMGHLNSIEMWRELFDKCKASDFLMGKSEKPFKATLSWLVDFDNIIKITEGKYDNPKTEEFKALF